ncbi:ATP-binding protein [Yersinia aldovae]|uniref:ATP-binding protein n=1 Tax=Yersinia aldovae TaxID=29483 RepID=UPI0028F44176|nr:ATP-binding protein [Yersinia aldovae]
MKLPFELDPQIIHHIIYSQAGSIGKALIELIMNSVDANANTVKLEITKNGFTCSDDGEGFANRDDVIRYFGRFGTPHQEGDATYGRFRLGRGQIMAHASTIWQSNLWQMTVDTRSMGYSYELDDIEENTGCHIAGIWYEILNQSELMTTIQEIRDLVRYTTIAVELNGNTITRDPRTENWDAEDDFAYYRAKEDGSVAIYNQGVLVRHDPAHIWGCGGLIVSKQAIGLNVSRTEILRKTCPVWKAIAKHFKMLANDISARLGDNRKTEARREKSARALLSGEQDIALIFRKEEVITVLPGKRHLTLYDFLASARYHYSRSCSIVENGFDIPKGEAMARAKITSFIHPKTLERFGCYNALDFKECLNRINNNLSIIKAHHHYYVPDLLEFRTLASEFLERTEIVDETKALDKETRRSWTALRWCLQNYASLCTGGQEWYTGKVSGGKNYQILLGSSNSAEAWTDGESYIAIDVNIVKRIKTYPLKAISYIFSILEHEIAHEGDSLDCGHDEAFF